MKGLKPLLIVAAVLVLVLVLTLFTFRVSETEQVVVTQFGSPKRQIQDAGLHFKIPFLEQVNTFEKRVLEWDGKPTQVPTLDKKYIWVDSFARWRIVDPLAFFKTVAREESAQGRLDDIINGSVRNKISNHPLIEAVRTTDRPMSLMTGIDGEVTGEVQKVEAGRDVIVAEVLEEARQAARGFGIEIIDIRFKRLNYVEEVRKSVYERMITERQRIAAKYRSEGEGQKLEIEGRKEKEEKQILSEAYKQAQQIMGKADAEAIKTYAEAYSRDPDFYSFRETLNSYEDNLGEGSVLVLSTDGAYLKYLKGDGQTLSSFGSAPPPAGEVASPPTAGPDDSCPTTDER
jgi:membrane protease subunit HflC